MLLSMDNVLIRDLPLKIEKNQIKLVYKNKNSHFKKGYESQQTRVKNSN